MIFSEKGKEKNEKIDIRILIKLKEKFLQEPYVNEKNWERYVEELVDEFICDLKGENNG